jgi:hypothetical protein
LKTPRSSRQGTSPATDDLSPLGIVLAAKPTVQRGYRAAI